MGVTIDYILRGELSGEAASRLKNKELLELFLTIENLNDEEKKLTTEVLKAIIIKSKIDGIKK